LKQTTQVVNENIKKLEQANSQLVDYTSALSTFDQMLPVDSSVEDYLADIVGVATKSGFLVSKATVQASNAVKNSVIIRLEITGPPKAVKLVSAIESIKRLSNIESLQLVNSSPKPSTTSVDVIIYFWKRLTVNVKSSTEAEFYVKGNMKTYVIVAILTAFSLLLLVLTDQRSYSKDDFYLKTGS
jgi:Tfp pilus assembly protein PilO